MLHVAYLEVFRVMSVFRPLGALGGVLSAPPLSLSARGNCGFVAEGDLLGLPGATNTEEKRRQPLYILFLFMYLLQVCLSLHSRE